MNGVISSITAPDAEEDVLNLVYFVANERQKEDPREDANEASMQTRTEQGSETTVPTSSQTTSKRHG